MRVAVTLSAILLVSALAGCDMRSQTAKDEMDKFSGTPTPTIAAATPEPPIDPADIVQANVDQQGDPISVSGFNQKKTVTCNKFNPVNVNGGSSQVTVKGPCRQMVVNGDGNTITIDAALSIVLNGDRNTVQYARYVNGKRPAVQDNAGSNTVEKISGK